MNIGKIFAGGLISLSLTAFAIPCGASIAPSPTQHRGPSTVSNAKPVVIAFGDDAEEHAERHERAERAKHKAERYTHSDRDEEHGGVRNNIREHLPGTAEHQLHEEREGEEHHNRDFNYDR